MKFLALLLTIAAPLAQAAAPQWQSIDSVRAAAEKLAREHYTRPGEIVNVRATLDDRLQMPSCATPLASRVQNAANGAIVAAVSCEAPSNWTLYVVVQVARETQVMVMTRPVRAGEVITADAVTKQKRNVGDLAFGYLESADIVLGQTARRALSAGAVLTSADLSAPRLVRRGEPVMLVSRSGPLVVRAEGKALADGAKDEYIAVENTKTRRVVRGKVHAQGEVDIDL